MNDNLKAALSLAFGLWTAAAAAGGNAQYCVIDLSGGANAAAYPVTYLDAAPAGGFNTDEYKTTKLVLKRVEAGSFIMGKNQSDESHRVTLTKPFCVGVFQVTQKQWSLVMGTSPSKFSGDTRPVEQVSYDMIRGEDMGSAWPTFNAVDEGSFLAVLRTKTGIDFDLPTEAQWEYACRAGTATTYNTGATEKDLKNAGWYDANSGGATHPVGEKAPNAWGLYDMHGNVWEWTLDWEGDLAYGIDPVGVSSARYRMLRGGGYETDTIIEASSWGREETDPPSDNAKSDFGFRLVAPAAEAAASADWPSWAVGSWSGTGTGYDVDEGTFPISLKLQIAASGSTCTIEDDEESGTYSLDGLRITTPTDSLCIASGLFGNGEDGIFSGTFAFNRNGRSQFKAQLADDPSDGTISGTMAKSGGIAPDLEASYGPFVPGERVEIAIPALVGYTAKGLPSGLKLDRKTGTVSGTPTKPTGDAGATATFTKKGAASATAQFVVGPVPEVSVALAGDVEKCKVTGGDKAYLAGKKVTLTAKAPKGTAFTGWTVDGVPWPDEETAKNAKLTFQMPSEDLALVASFEKEKMSLACEGLAEGSFTVGVMGDEDEGIPLEIFTQSGIKSVKASKLPSGMKLVRDKTTDEWSIVGTPTKAGKCDVVLTVTAKSGATETVTVPVTVAPLPAWATGTFGGMIGRLVKSEDKEDEEDFRPYGTVSLKVTAAGRITAKVQAGGKTYSFSAKGFSGYDAEREAYLFEMETKAGDVYAGEVAKGFHDVATLVSGGGADDPEGYFSPAGREDDDPYSVIIWRNEHGKDGHLGDDATGRAKAAMDAVKALRRVALADFDPNWGTVAVTIGANGVTKFSGKTADGVKVSAAGFLALDDDGCHVVSDLVYYDRKTKRVHAGAVCWQPVFDDAGNLVDLDDTCCDRSLLVYPFE